MDREALGREALGRRIHEAIKFSLPYEKRAWNPRPSEEYGAAGLSDSERENFCRIGETIAAEEREAILTMYDSRVETGGVPVANFIDRIRARAQTSPRSPAGPGGNEEAGLRAWEHVKASLAEGLEGLPAEFTGPNALAIEAALVRESHHGEERIRRPEVAEVFCALIAEQDGFTLTHAFRLKVANLLNRMDIEIQENRERETALVLAAENASLAARQQREQREAFIAQLAKAEARMTALKADLQEMEARLLGASGHTRGEWYAIERERDAALAKLAKAEERAVAAIAVVDAARTYVENSRGRAEIEMWAHRLALTNAVAAYDRDRMGP